MKTITLTLALFLALSTQAQNKNVQKETQTTVTTIKDSDGEKKLVKQEQTEQVQDIKLQDAKANTLNIDVQPSPVDVVKTTQITNADGSTRTVDVDRSGYYQGENNMKYKVALDAQGYTMMSDGYKKPDLMRKTSINTYFYRNKNTTAISYFDTQGNLVIETYDDKADKVSTQKYTRVNQ